MAGRAGEFEHEAGVSDPVSVIVPAHGDAPDLVDALHALVEQADAQDELILVDNHLRPDALTRLDGLTSRITVVRAHDGRGAAFARNCGVRASRHRKLVFCDSDDVAAPGALDALRTALSAHPMVGADVEFRTLNPGRTDLGDGDPGVMHWSDSADWPFVGTCGLGVTRDVFDRVGGFDEHIPSLEDIDFSFRAVLAGIRPVGADGAVIRFRYRMSPWDEARRLFAMGRASVWLERRYGQHGMPRASKARGVLGWVRHVGGLLQRDRLARGTHLGVIGWKAGRLRALLDRDGSPDGGG